LRNSDEDRGSVGGGTARGSKSYVLFTATTVLLPLRAKAPPALRGGDVVAASGRGRIGGDSTSSLGNGVGGNGAGDGSALVAGVGLDDEIKADPPCQDAIQA
jgi:hypothetical protein